MKVLKKTWKAWKFDWLNNATVLFEVFIEYGLDCKDAINYPQYNISTTIVSEYMLFLSYRY